VKGRGASIAAGCVAACATLAAHDARAFEHQHHLGVDGGLSMLSVGDKPTWSIGGGGGIHYAYGLNDAFNLMIEGAFGPVALDEQPGPGIKNNRPTMVENVGAGVGWVLDVTRWVPYFGALATTMVFHGGTVDGVRFAGALTVAAGLDYMVTRKLGLGFAFRWHLPVTDLNDYPTYLQFFLRAEYVWGF
jgi:hypothetical protein